MSDNQFHLSVRQYGPLVALMVAVVAMLGSLYFSEVAKFIPCTLCWYQRILMYPLVVVIAVGMIGRDARLPHYVLPLSVAGIAVATYHYLLEWGIISSSPACTIGVSCASRYINWLGFITIAFLALVAFTLITITMLLLLRANRARLSAA